MCEQDRNDLFFTCSLIEQLGRDLHAKRGEVARTLGLDGVRLIFDHADVFHCEPIIKVSDDIQREFSLVPGDFDNVQNAKFAVPSVWTIGKVYARLIEDVCGENDVAETILAVYTSWINEALSNYNTAFYYQPRDYIAECYREGQVLDD